MNKKSFDVIIIGGSYSGLSAAMALGRALRTVLVVDSGNPCNKQTPHSHNFLTQDGTPPAEIASMARQQVQMYNTVQLVNGLAIGGTQTRDGFEIKLDSGDIAFGMKLIFATGIKDKIADIPGVASCWGISVLHCPYCHGYEVANRPTAILADGDVALEVSTLINNWTKDLILLTNGPSSLSDDQHEKLRSMNIRIEQASIQSLQHDQGKLREIVLRDGRSISVEALYTRPAFQQHCMIPFQLGCEITPEGYLKVDSFQRTTVPGVFASGDNVTRMRTVSSAVAMGTIAGISVSRELIFGPW